MTDIFNENQKKVPEVSVIIVTWNSMRYIFDCFESLIHQTFRDFSVTVIDNGSYDGTVEFIRTHYPNIYILQNFKNLGFSRAYNQGIRLSSSPYVLVMNDDVVLNENFLFELVGFARMHVKAGSLGGKMLKLYTGEINVSERAGGLKELIKTDKIDSAGLKIYKSRRVINRGEHQQDVGQFDRTEEVFGISGACVLFRKEALEDIKIKDEYFDQDFFAYKEDIDIAWRLRLYGWENYYVPAAVGYHHRRLGGSAKSDSWALARHRQKLPRLLRHYSFRNHHLMLVKNLLLVNVFRHLIYIGWYEIKLLCYVIFFEPFLIKSLLSFFRQLPNALLKRNVIMGHRKISPQQIRIWFK
ncbi:glycosyltransferase family 2 protein [Candidatus Parcubacteria bacterium]|nr:MAG: glycosyltransferase family 2 protein [Candidatus Parcubacteria bacterium]